MGMYEKINEFVDAMMSSEEKFKDVKASFDNKNSGIEKCIQKFHQDVSNVISKKIETEDKDIQKMYNGFSDELRELLSKVALCMENTKKGMKFITDYEQSFNIAVFGKVKAGKSYLGNFIMGNSIRDLGKKTSYDNFPRPRVEVYDRGKKSIQGKLAEISEEGNEEFRVDPIEATSAIQLFHLGGMTWFDTPGIGSITWENEMLAKEYVDNADLIVYTSNSDAAGIRQDFLEMKDLDRKGKAFLLLLTQSDTVKEKVEDGEIISKLVPKNRKDRMDTEDYICDTLREHNIAGLDRGREILTISTKLAFTALENEDEQMFEDSNIGKFLEILTDITRNDGAELKLKTPGSRINATFLSILEQLQEAQHTLEKYKESLLGKQKQMSEERELFVERIQPECLKKIGRIIREKGNEIESQESSISAAELGGLLNREVYQTLSRACIGEFAKSGEILSKYADKLNIGSVGELKMKTDTIEYTVQKVVQVSRDPHGLWEHLGSFFLNKEYYRSEVENDTETKVVALGVNEQQIMAAARDKINELFEETVPAMVKEISEQLMTPMIGLLEEADESIRETIMELEILKC